MLVTNITFTVLIIINGKTEHDLSSSRTVYSTYDLDKTKEMTETIIMTLLKKSGLEDESLVDIYYPRQKTGKVWFNKDELMTIKFKDYFIGQSVDDAITTLKRQLEI